MDIGIRADGMTTSDFENFTIEIVKRKFKNSSLHGFKEGKDDGIDGIDDIKSPSLIILISIILLFCLNYKIHMVVVQESLPVGGLN